MKVVVFSDSHGDVLNMVEAVGKERPSRIFHLGDVASDVDDLRPFFPGMPIEQVSGNCDGWHSANLPQEVLTEVGGKMVCLLHGHTVGVKLGMETIVDRADALKVDIMLFGHTHIPYCQIHHGRWLVNPGSIRAGQYALLEVEDGVIHCNLHTIEEGTRE